MCDRCDFLATEVMRLREDRNEWRHIEIMMRGMCDTLNRLLTS